MNNEKMREEFEAWMISGWAGSGTFENRMSNADAVAKREVDCAWQAWQAATAATQRNAMDVAEAVLLAMAARIETLERGRDAARNFGNCAKLELERVQAERDQARLEGWRTARDQSHKACTEYAENLVHGNVDRAIGADRCASTIRAMQPPAEWSDHVEHNLEMVPIAIRGDASGAIFEWPHDDGFGGGLTERNRDG